MGSLDSKNIHVILANRLLVSLRIININNEKLNSQHINRQKVMHTCVYLSQIIFRLTEQVVLVQQKNVMLPRTWDTQVNRYTDIKVSVVHVYCTLTTSSASWGGICSIGLDGGVGLDLSLSWWLSGLPEMLSTTGGRGVGLEWSSSCTIVGTAQKQTGLYMLSKFMHCRNRLISHMRPKCNAGTCTSLRAQGTHTYGVKLLDGVDW